MALTKHLAHLLSLDLRKNLTGQIAKEISYFIAVLHFGTYTSKTLVLGHTELIFSNLLRLRL